MKHGHPFGLGRTFSPPDDRSGPHHHHGHHRGHKPGRRLFDYGDLRLLILSMIADTPRHGYELIKAIEEKFGGSYVPSPGVIYPTLSWLDDMGYAQVAPVEGGRKRYRITPEGEAFLTANRNAVDELIARGSSGAHEGRRNAAPQVIAAMDNLKAALRTRFRDGTLDDEAADRIADIINRAAQDVEAGQ